MPEVGDAFRKLGGDGRTVVVVELVGDRYIRVADKNEPQSARLWRVTSLEASRAKPAGKHQTTVNLWLKQRQAKKK